MPNSKIWVTVAILFFPLFIVACDQDWGKKMEFGRPIPDARLEVFLSNPIGKYELFLRMKDSANLAGYSRLVGNPRLPVQPSADTKPRNFDWHSIEGAPHFPHRVSFMFRPREALNPSSFIFIFRHSKTSGFEAKEWRLFYEWKDVFLPKFFPETRIEVTRHPALNTDFKELIDISRSTGIPIPESIMKKYKAWREENK